MPTKKNENETPKRRGRKPTFQEDTVAFMVHIPANVRQMVREVAEQRGEPLNATVARFIEAGHKQATRNRKRSTKSAPAAETAAND